tara:strand:- start:326 stop:1558 length:1233 start_codon:yes stop_codon:yes gene_type:complete
MDHKINIKLLSKKGVSNNIVFDIKGDSTIGLDKSIINALRRTILSGIPTIGFRTDIDQSDIKIVKNNTSLHNEFLLHRFALLPLYIDPIDYNKQYLFYLNVENIDQPIKTITAGDINIYPLKKNIDPDLLKEIDINNYDTENPINDKQKNNILRPFRFKNKNEYCILTELKNTNSKIKQSLELYGVPRVSYAHEDARWQSVSCATYSFKKNDELFKKVLKEKSEIEEIKDKKDFEKALFIKDSERYFYRDIQAEPFWYTFKIDSQHHYSSKEIFITACEIITKDLEIFSKELPKIISDEDCIMSLNKDKNNENIYEISVQNYDNTIGNLLQNYISRYLINNKSVLNLCGYKKEHPLEQSISFKLSINPNNKIFNQSIEQKLVAMIQIIQEACADLINIFAKINAEADSKL